MKAMALGLLALGALGCDNPSFTPDMAPGCTSMLNGACLATLPTDEAQRTPCTEAIAGCDPTGVARPSLACLASPVSPSGGPTSVTLSGRLVPFSSGMAPAGASVSVFDATPLLAGTSIFAATPIASEANVALDMNSQVTYSLASVPTNRQLAVRTTGANNAPDSLWTSAITWNVFLASNARACSATVADDCLDTSTTPPTYRLALTVVSHVDVTAVPVAGGLTGGLQPGLGWVLGQVRDCDDVLLANAAVGVSPSAARFVYFDGMLPPAPDSSRVETSRLGLYGAFDQPPGRVHVVAAGLVSGALQSLGSFDAFVYPDIVSIVNINGGKPSPSTTP